MLVKSNSGRNWNVGRLDIDLSAGAARVTGSRLFYLDRSYAESSEMLKAYSVYNTRVRELAMKQTQEMKAKFDAILIRRGIDPSAHRRVKVFAGSAACMQCHDKAGEIWSRSGHAMAFATLKKTDQEFDPECVTCHTTGASVRGGFTNAQDTPDYVNVQCEACHGPGVAHVAKPRPASARSARNFCRGCHTDELSPDFDYDIMWKKIAH